MITPSIKNQAIMKIKARTPLEDIAREMDLPMPILKEWVNNLDGKDLMQLQANIHAVETFTKQEIILPNGNEEVLRTKIEEVAVEIVDQVSLTVGSDDVMRAKTLQLCADTITKLYDTLINKEKSPDGILKPNGRAITAFQSIMKD